MVALLIFVKHLGLWGIVNNAGVAGIAGPLLLQRKQDILKTVDVNFYGVMDVTKTFLPLLQRNKGRIVNMSSFGGFITNHINFPYCVSKYAVESFSDAIRCV